MLNTWGHRKSLVVEKVYESSVVKVLIKVTPEIEPENSYTEGGEEGGLDLF